MEALTADFRVPEGTEALSPRFASQNLGTQLLWDRSGLPALPGVGCPVSWEAHSGDEGCRKTRRAGPGKGSPSGGFLTVVRPW